MRFHELRVASVEPLTPESVTVSFAVPSHLSEDFEFTPGQHLIVERDGHRRTYSICVRAGSGQLKVAVKHLPGGFFSTWANQAMRAGDTLSVAAPAGTFTLDVDPANHKRYVAIAAGSGITPVLSLAATLLEGEPNSQFALVYGNRTVATTMFLEDLEDLKDLYPDRFELICVFSREPQPVDLFSGRLDGERLQRLLDAMLPVGDVDEWLLCGPLGMIEATREALGERGVEPAHVHREIFYADAPVGVASPADGDPEDVASVTIRLGGRESKLPVARDGAPILDSVLLARSDAPYACRGGVCGTCRARVLEGEVRMDTQYALEPGEIEAGYVLACQAHPVSKRVLLDFDR
jgi:ring-1,2-phenylacetyl-CoA epoxidase subunit PaaE